MDCGTDEAIPGRPGAVAARMFETLCAFVAPGRLSLGDGTVLAARWSHRRLLDIDLFCEPNAYGSLAPAALARLEAAIKAIPGCADQFTWCDPIATYAEIDGLEVTMLPMVTVIEPDRPTRLAGTKLALQGNAQILYAKIAGRMYGAGEIAVRDAYDLASARLLDLPALQAALDRSGPRVLRVVNEIIRRLPRGWSAGAAKPLLEPRFVWSEGALKDATLDALAALPSHGGRSGEGPGR